MSTTQPNNKKPVFRHIFLVTKALEFTPIRFGGLHFGWENRYQSIPLLFVSNVSYAKSVHSPNCMGGTSFMFIRWDKTFVGRVPFSFLVLTDLFTTPILWLN
jgi:hypothetical protein